MNADGSGIRQLTDTPENELSKSWSPDGTRVVADFQRISPGGLHKGDIAVIAVSSGTEQNLTDTPGIDELHPDWSPR
jgi:WD40-like Beta Propeller Repeat